MNLIWVSLLLFLVSSYGLKNPSDEEWYSKKVANHQVGSFSAPKFHVLRLSPNEDLLDSLWKFARVKSIRAASIVSTVGSLITTNIRYANQEDGTSLNGHFEITSLVGNIDDQSLYDGSGHIHISIANETGASIGGHLLFGNLIYTTAEITLVELTDAWFKREPDTTEGGSGYYELTVYPNPNLRGN